MCSIGEDDFGDEGGLHTMQKETLQCDLNPEEVCAKCKNDKVAVKLPFREPECKECFLAYARHKFRAALGSSKVLPKGSTVLLMVDGSPGSIVLLDMLNYAKTQNNFKRLHCLTKVLYIDESVLAEGHAAQDLNEVAEFLTNFDFGSYFVPLSGTQAAVEFKDFNAEGDSTFAEKLSNIKTLTSKQDFVQKHRNNLIAAVAAQLSCDFVFLPDICTSLAATLLTNISLGRGSSTALDVSLIDDRFEGLKCVRPLKNLTELEIEMYMNVRGLKALNRTTYGEDKGISASIQNLTRNFVSNLQKDYPSTVSTVFRTGDKISAKSLEDSLQSLSLQTSKCSLCKSNLDYFDSDTLMAIEFSRLVSENAASSLENIEQLEAEAKKRLNGADELQRLCHGCRNIFSDFVGENQSPIFN